MKKIKKILNFIIKINACLVLFLNFYNISTQNCKPRKICFPVKKDYIPKCGTKTFFLARPQGANLARIYSGWNNYIPYCCEDSIWGDFYMTVEYTRSFKPERIAQYFFGTNILNFKSSNVQNRNPKTDILGDNFGLATDFEGQISFEPRVENIIMELNAKLGLDCWINGLYFEVHAPITRTWYNIGINCNEKNNSNLINNYFNAGYMSQNGTASVKTILKALSGTAMFGDMQEPINFGKFACGKLEETGLADLNLIFGRNLLSGKNGHFAGYAKLIIPTGTKTEAEYIFEPIVGNGKLWELGFGIDSLVNLYQNSCHQLTLFLNGYITYRFKKIETRSFNLKNDEIENTTLSRYLLLKEFVKDQNGNIVYYDPSNVVRNNSGRLVNAINYSTDEVIVKGGLRSEALLKLSYYYSKFGIEAGYNAYGTTKEHLKIIPDLYPSDLNNVLLGIKGTAPVYNGNTVINDTQNNATIYSPGTNDNPPIILKLKNIDKNSGRINNQLTNKFFASINYTNFESNHQEQFTFGGEYEIDAQNKLRNSLNQWGIWGKLSFAF